MYKNDNTDFPNTAEILSFNPCFNGTMYKNPDPQRFTDTARLSVSILVLMELCIKTRKGTERIRDT